jgi:uncharacterized protein
MSEPSGDIATLERALVTLGDRTLSIGGLDGLLAAVLVCPEPVPTEEWLSRIWVVEDDEDAFTVEDTPEAAAAVGEIIKRFHEMAAELERGAFLPIYDVDGRFDEALWEIWADGFETGMSLRPDAWLPFLASRDDASAALGLLISLLEIGKNDPDAKAELGAKTVKELSESAPDLLPECVQVLFDAGRPPQKPIVRGPKVGRNDPCPCGSGKKFKKCCGVG